MSDTDTDTDDEAQDEQAFDPDKARLDGDAEELFGYSAEDTAEPHTPDANPGGSGAMTGPQDEAYDPLTLYDLQRHRNGDETALLVCAFGDGYQVIAFDVDAGGQLLEVETVGDTDDADKAVGMAEYWLEQNPEGVLGGAPADGGGGVLEKLGFGGGDS